MASIVTTYTELETAVTEKLRLETGDSTLVNTWINHALARIAEETGYFKQTTVGTALAVGDGTEPIPTGMITIDYIVCSYGAQAPQLARASNFESILNMRSHGVSSGPPTTYAVFGPNVELWPSAAGGEVLTYYGSKLPDEISGTDPCPLPEPFSKLVEYGALYEGAQFKKDPLYDEFRTLHEFWKTRFVAYLNRLSGAQGQTFRIMGSGNSYVPHDPSSDWDLVSYWS
jgi:hypothetical protein